MNKDDLASAVAAAVSNLSQADAKRAVEAVFDGVTSGMKAVSYTHLTLPTTLSV